MARAFVVGHPIAHSRSPLIHGHWLERLGIPGSYTRVDVAPDRLADFLATLGEQGFAGGNVTLPHKEAAFRLVERRTDHAERLGAVNTVWIDPEGHLWGDNTDGGGFLANLDQALPGWAGEVGTALVLGAGGAARAIVAALLDRGVHELLVGNRTLSAAQQFARLDPGRISSLNLSEVAGALPRIDLLINTTQLGMTGQPQLDLDVGRLPAHAIVADIVYVPLETALLASARARGLRVADGLGMLLHQAVAGFPRWFGQAPEVTPELRALVAADIARAA